MLNGVMCRVGSYTILPRMRRDFFLCVCVCVSQK